MSIQNACWQRSRWGIEIPDQGRRSTEIGAWNRCTIPGVEKKEDGLHSNPDRIALVCHDFEPFVEISIDLFDQHWIVIATRKDVLVYLQEVNSFLENNKKLAILVEDDSVAEAEMSLNFHDCGGKCR